MRLRKLSLLAPYLRSSNEDHNALRRSS